MTVEDLYKFQRVAAPQISPDGKTVVYQVSTVDLARNKSSSALWIAPTDGKGQPKQLTDPQGKKDSNPCWSPDGTLVLFESNRTGTSQLWTVAADGALEQITDISTGAANGIWSPDGTHVAFVSAVYPEFSDKPFAESNKLNKQKEDEIEKSPVKAKVFTQLFFRHWDEYVGDKRQHLFVQRVAYARHESPRARKAWLPRDVTPGDRDAYPTSTTFSSDDDFTFTPDSKHLVFTAVPEKKRPGAPTTTSVACRSAIPRPKWESLTKDNKAADSGPKFSPDGKKLAWRAQKTPGYEADAWDIIVVGREAGRHASRASQSLYLANQSRRFSVNEFIWAKIWESDQRRTQLGFIFSADQNGSQPLYLDHPRRTHCDSSHSSQRQGKPLIPLGQPGRHPVRLQCGSHVCPGGDLLAGLQ